MYRNSRDKRSVETCKWIYEALERLMEEIPYHKISIKALCEEARIGRVSFYRHYDTIDDVLRKRCDEKFDGLISYIKEYRKTDNVTKHILKPFLRYWYDDSKVIKLILMAEKQYLFEESFERVVASAERLHNEQQQFQRNEYLSSIQFAISLTILKIWIEKDMNISPDDLTDLIINQMKAVLILDEQV